MSTIVGLVTLIVAFLIGMFFNRKAGPDAKILDLTSKIKDNQDKAAKQKEEADKKTQEYLDALKKYDPKFHGDDDDNGGHSA
jgi:F0F1-type ATP synthase membrane subunit b/b'